jgi:ribosomal protein S15P/S13E
MEQRLNEMVERRRRLIKYMFKKEDKLDEFESSYIESINKKNLVIQRFSST